MISLFRFLNNLYQILLARPAIPASLEENQLLKTILNRRSTRSFTEKEIPQEILQAILEAGRLAPSTVNLQTWSFAVFTRSEWRETFERDLPFKAPQAIMILGDTYRMRSIMDSFPDSPLVEYTVAVMNASLSAMNMNIAAESLGISSVMLSETGRSGLLDAAYIQKALSLPGGVYPLMTLLLGYPRHATGVMPPKLPLEEIVIHQKYPETNLETMNTWFEHLQDGYKASYPGSSLVTQLEAYRKKIAQAEIDLDEMIYARSGK